MSELVFLPKSFPNNNGLLHELALSTSSRTSHDLSIINSNSYSNNRHGRHGP